MQGISDVDLQQCCGYYATNKCFPIGEPQNKIANKKASKRGLLLESIIIKD